MTRAAHDRQAEHRAAAHPQAEYANQQALCYAKRYPELLAKFCREDTCDRASLLKHFEDIGRAEERVYGCLQTCKPSWMPRSICPLQSQPAVLAAYCRGNLMAAKYGAQANMTHERQASHPHVRGLSTAEVVVAQCKQEQLSFLLKLAASVTESGMQLIRISVYSKCGSMPRLPSMPIGIVVQTQSTANYGRNDQTWAEHFARWYDELADVVLLVKDSMPCDGAQTRAAVTSRKLTP